MTFLKRYSRASNNNNIFYSVSLFKYFNKYVIITIFQEFINNIVTDKTYSYIDFISINVIIEVNINLYQGQSVRRN